MTSEREDKCRRVAEWFEPCPINPPWTVPLLSPKRAWTTSTPAICDGRHVYHWVPRDFYGDEAANALLLEAMPYPMVWKSSNGDWSCYSDFRLSATMVTPTEDNHRRAAVVEAFIKWKEAALKLIESERRL